jgi:hypothetical protein
LNWDGFTNLVLSLLNSPTFSHFLDALDVNGQALAQLTAPPLSPTHVGLIMYYAYALSAPFDFASNPVVIEVVP